MWCKFAVDAAADPDTYSHPHSVAVATKLSFHASGTDHVVALDQFVAGADGSRSQ